MCYGICPADYLGTNEETKKWRIENAISGGCRKMPAFFTLKKEYSTLQNMLKSSGLLFAASECYSEITENKETKS